MKSDYLQYTSENKVEEFIPVSFRTELTAGWNYFVKVRTGPGSYVHLRISEDLQGKVSLKGVLTNKTDKDPIEPFRSNIEHKSNISL